MLGDDHLAGDLPLGLVAALDLEDAAVGGEGEPLAVAVLDGLDELHAGEVRGVPQQRLGDLPQVEHDQLVRLEQQEHVRAAVRVDAAAEAHAGDAHRRPVGVVDLDRVETPDARANRRRLCQDRRRHHAAPLVGP